jgi:hypothetical protein
MHLLRRYAPPALVVGSMLALGCGRSDSPVAPSQTTQVVVQNPGSAAVPPRVLPSVGLSMPSVIGFPPRNEPNLFFQDLTALYRDTLGRAQNSPTYVDPEGENVWLTEYFRFSLNGCSHAEAVNRTLSEITSGGSQPVCGDETPTFPPRDLPNAFQGQLENTYRTILGRSPILSYVDSEGANVWLAQYLRFRVSGCSHAVAQEKVFTEIRGGGVQPDCTPVWSRYENGDLTFEIPASVRQVFVVATCSVTPRTFVVYMNGRLVVNAALGPGYGTWTFSTTLPNTGGLVEVHANRAVTWSFSSVIP